LAPLKASKLTSILKKDSKNHNSGDFLLYINDSYNQKTVHPVMDDFSFLFFSSGIDMKKRLSIAYLSSVIAHTFIVCRALEAPTKCNFVPPKE
jgi:hypothetical protein